ncbi:MAG: two-component regulator propeller domain-containing protein [Bacteroidota bacterium]
MKNIVLSLITFIVANSCVAQTVPIFKWQDHLSYRSGMSVTEGGGKVYCATKGGIFVYNKGDNSMERLSKVNGLSDVEAVVINYNKYNNKVLIAYKNANLDILTGTAITNLPDIKNKNIVGNKSINSVYMLNQYAYLACGFGIVVIDMNRMEVNDTYFLLNAIGGALNVRDLTSDNNYLYAATDSGVYRASVNAPSLADNTAWKKITGKVNGVYSGAINGKYNSIVAFNGKIYANFSKYLYSNFLSNPPVVYYINDSVKVFDGTSWTSPTFMPATGYTARQLEVCNNHLLVVLDGQVNVYDTAMHSIYYFGGDQFCFNDKLRAVAAAFDSDGGTWFADDRFGLLSWRPSIGCESRYPNGPANEFVTNMSTAGDNLLVAPGGVNGSWQSLYLTDGVFSYNNNTWSAISGNHSPIINLDTTFDIMNVLIDTNDTRHAYASTWGSGILEFYDGVPIKHWDHSNSNGALMGINSGGSGPVLNYGIALDAANNLWVSSTLVTKALARKTFSGSWTGIDFSAILGNSGATLSQVLVDKNDQKWMIIARGGGLMVYKAGTTATANLSTNTKFLSTSSGNGLLPSTEVDCIAEDKNGEIWIGTNKGIAVFYSPENVFVPGANFDAQQILLEQDGHVQILLLTELVQAIAVDDANRKWIGTTNSGVFLMSADGTQQIYHFDAANSPLFSNDVRSIAINHKTGEVYFGTAKGIISFRGSSTEGNPDFGQMYAFPNPVKPNYDGPIAITGLMGNSTVKITDVVGNLVFQTTSEGGQALWYGKNFKGERVSTGVYMVFCTNADGSQKAVTKILFIN